MRIIYFSTPITIILCFILWPLIQAFFAWICNRITDDYYSRNRFIFNIHKWEKNGVIYNSLLKVKKWKKYLPDGAAMLNKGYRKKELNDISFENLNKYLVESKRAELTHILAIPPFMIFGLFLPIEALIYMLIYALIVNMPCIIVQRYNRPRIQHLISCLRKYD